MKIKKGNEWLVLGKANHLRDIANKGYYNVRENGKIEKRTFNNSERRDAREILEYRGLKTKPVKRRASNDGFKLGGSIGSYDNKGFRGLW